MGDLSICHNANTALCPLRHTACSLMGLPCGEGGPLIERGPALKAPYGMGGWGRSGAEKKIPYVRVCDYDPVLPVGRSLGLIASNAL